MRVKRSLYKRIVLLFCIIFLVPTVILKGFYYPRMREIMYQGVTEESAQSLRLLRATADSRFFEFHKIWNNVNRNNIFLTFPRNHSTTQVIEIQNMLGSQFRLSSNLHKALLVPEDGDQVFSDRGSMLRSRFYAFMQESANLDMRNSDIFKSDTLQVLYTDSDYLTLVYPLRKTAVNPQNHSLILLLDLRLFLGRNTYGEDWIFLNEPSNILIQWTHPLVLEDVAAAVRQIGEHNFQYEPLSLRFENFIVNITHSYYLDLHYVRIVSLSNTNLNISNLNNQALLLTLALLLLGSIMFHLHMRYNYLPYTNMMYMLSENEICSEEDQSIVFTDEEEFMKSSLKRLIEVKEAYKRIQNAPGFEWYPADMMGELSVAINRFNLQKTEELLYMISHDLQDPEVPLYVT